MQLESLVHDHESLVQIFATLLQLQVDLAQVSRVGFRFHLPLVQVKAHFHVTLVTYQFHSLQHLLQFSSHFTQTRNSLE